MFIFYVSDQQASRDFYREILEIEPAFGKGTLRSEMYLLVDELQRYLERAVKAGATLLSECQARDWGDWADYCLDTDGHVLGFGKPTVITEK